MRSVLALIPLVALAITLIPLPAEGARLVIAFDVSHSQSPRGLELLANMTRGLYRVLIVFDDNDIARVPNTTRAMFNEIRRGGFTTENLRDVDILIIGQPEALLRERELDALREWFSRPNRALWIAADSDYPAQGSERAQIFMNRVLEALGSVIRIDHVSIEDTRENAGGAVYRVVGIVDPSPEVSFLAQGLQHRRVLFHGPGGLFVLVNNRPINPVKDVANKPANVYIIVRTSEDSRPVDNSPQERQGMPPIFYDPLRDGVNRGPYPLMLAEVHPNNRLIIASSETMYGGYQHMIITRSHDRDLDGPAFVSNVLSYMQSVVNRPLVETRTQTVTQVVTQTQTQTLVRTETATVTTTEQVTNLTTAAIVALAALIVGLAASFFIRK